MALSPSNNDEEQEELLFSVTWTGGGKGGTTGVPPQHASGELRLGTDTLLGFVLFGIGPGPDDTVIVGSMDPPVRLRALPPLPPTLAPPRHAALQTIITQGTTTNNKLEIHYFGFQNLHSKKKENK